MIEKGENEVLVAGVTVAVLATREASSRDEFREFDRFSTEAEDALRARLGELLAGVDLGMDVRVAVV